MEIEKSDLLKMKVNKLNGQFYTLFDLFCVMQLINSKFYFIFINNNYIP